MSQLRTIELESEDIALIDCALKLWADSRDKSTQPGFKKEITQKIRDIKKKLK